MKPTLCSKCKKNLAVVFITKIENGETINEGYCLKCAKELGIKPVDDMISRMGLSDEDLESISGEMLTSVVMNISIVAMFGQSIPTPLHMAPIRHLISPS